MAPDSGSEALTSREHAEEGQPLRFWVETWGCQMNAYDSERFASQLAQLGYGPARQAGEADLILLNTCSIREKAAEKLFSRLGRLRELKLDNPDLVIGVAGCVAQQEGANILRRSKVPDFVIGPRAVSRLKNLIENAREGRRGVDIEQNTDRYDEIVPITRSLRHRAPITIVEGCDKTCSYCVVPFTRGAEINRSPESVLHEVNRAVESGAVEVELLGQNVNAYRSGAVDFADLLRRVGAVPGLRRLRFTTSHPREFTDRVIHAMAETEVVANHLHLPVQSGSDRVLKQMFRGYDRTRYLSRIDRLREKVPDVAISTDIIVGFPGETEQDFLDTLCLLDEVAFDQVFAFVYSPRPQTRAAELADPVPLIEKEERLQRLFAHQDRLVRPRMDSWIGRVVEVLVDAEDERRPGMVHGRTRDNRILNFQASAEVVGRLLDVKVTRAFAHSLFGEVVAPLN